MASEQSTKIRPDQATKRLALGSNTLFDSDGDNTAQVCKTSGGLLWGLVISNSNAADAFLQLFDVAAGSVTVGTTAPKLSLLVPKGDGTASGAVELIFPKPIYFENAITYACTTTATGNTDPTVGLVVNLIYD